MARAEYQEDGQTHALPLENKSGATSASAGEVESIANPQALEIGERISNSGRTPHYYDKDVTRAYGDVEDGSHEPNVRLF